MKKLWLAWTIGILATPCYGQGPRPAEQRKPMARLFGYVGHQAKAPFKAVFSSSHEEEAPNPCPNGRHSLEDHDELPRIPFRKVADKGYWLDIAAISGAAVLDAEGSIRCVQAGRCKELNPVFGSARSRLRVYGIKMALLPIQAWALYKYDERGWQQDAFCETDGWPRRAHWIAAIGTVVPAGFGIEGIVLSQSPRQIASAQAAQKYQVVQQTAVCPRAVCNPH